MLHTPRPPLNTKLFPVHRPGGLKRADWNFFFFIFKKKKIFYFPPVRSSFKKKEIRKGKKIPTSRPPQIIPTRPTGNTFLLKGGPMRPPLKKCLFPVQRVAEIVASRAGVKSFPPPPPPLLFWEENDKILTKNFGGAK